MKTDSKARFQGYKFYFREGLCWIDVNSTYLKARLKGIGVFDVLSMSLFTQMQIPDSYFVAVINSELISLYVDNFINNTSHFQINDARQLPVVLPTAESLDGLVDIVTEACAIKARIPNNEDVEKLNSIQRIIDETIRTLYQIY